AREQAAANRRAVASLREALVQAGRRSDEQAEALRRRQADVRAADLARHFAERARADARSALERHQRIVTRVEAALAALEAARQDLPADATLSDAARKLEARIDELRSAVPDLEVRLDIATRSHRKATDAFDAANRDREASAAEKSRGDRAVATA